MEVIHIPNEKEQKMVELSNLEGNLTLAFSFVNDPDNDIDLARSEFENWLFFMLKVTTPFRVITVTDVKASMTFYEIRKIYEGLSNLLCKGVDETNRVFSHCSSEYYFEIEVEYLEIDSCFSVELWINVNDDSQRVYGYSEGFRFDISESGLNDFTEGLRLNAISVYPKCFD